MLRGRIPLPNDRLCDCDPAADVSGPVVVVGPDRPDLVGLDQHHVDVEMAHPIPLGGSREVVVQVDEPTALVVDEPDLTSRLASLFFAAEGVESIGADQPSAPRDTATACSVRRHAAAEAVPPDVAGEWRSS